MSNQSLSRASQKGNAAAQSPLALSIVADVKAFLRTEADAISHASENLNGDELIKALDLLLTCTGKVIVLGVGKSGLVARKIAATMTSTGTAAIYLHAADAQHGDLGLLTASDVVIALSNSGETDELISLLPHLKSRGASLIALVGNLTSTLARAADAVLDAHVQTEAGHLQLAPTTSTTVALALGDALALMLMKLKNFTAEDFAINHPAGRLGKRLTLRVKDLMHSGKNCPMLSLDASWLEVISSISTGGLGAVCIVSQDGHLEGLITDGDLRRTLQKVKPDDLAALPAKTFMTKNPTTLSPEMLAFDALKEMENRPSQISVAPVVDEKKNCVGLIRVHDIVRSGL
jgi:arabinose-5-phosphate isomerase